ncbi:PqqD family protein [Oricola sp.]|uniref:PqqD family protein n=1 Tax=Oricola sp. TaxID=1979950 RepID=UPI0025EC610D|nr:PqqD family protein [Oricola sp.]MCI5078376.1 PqqD family protein [Oricola sp.]
MQSIESEGAMAGSFRLNEPAVIADDIDGEIVIMNLERGSYYGLDAVGADVWRMMMSGDNGAQIADRIVAHFGADADHVRADIATLIAKTLEHGLVVPVESPAPNSTDTAPEMTAGQYNAPELTVYSDMKDLLAFDPPLPAYDPVSGK